jgi:hypothetical protein
LTGEKRSSNFKFMNTLADHYIRERCTITSNAQALICMRCTFAYFVDVIIHLLQMENSSKASYATDSLIAL